jgi:GNAT superfamily N-acetyltransferase
MKESLSTECGEGLLLSEISMPGSLIAVEFTEQHLPLVQTFACGEESYERELAEWIRLDSVSALNCGCKVWLYVTSEKEIVGYGSLGVTRWNYPEPSSKRAALALIPAVAIQKEFWGKPDGPREGRYSSQILDHLITEAGTHPIDVPLLGLFVHPENHRAIKAYERAGFQPFLQTYTDKTSGVIYRSMIRPLILSAER